MSSIIKVDQIQLANGSTPTAADLGLNVSGSVLQVVTYTWASQFTYSGQTKVSVNTLQITPKSSTSKIIYQCAIPHYAQNGGGAWGASSSLFLFQDGVGVQDTEHFGTITDEQQSNEMSLTYITQNLPAGTPVSFELKTSVTLGSATHYFNRSPRKSSFIIMEIAG